MQIGMVNPSFWYWMSQVHACRVAGVPRDFYQLFCLCTLFILVNVLAPVTEVTPVPHSLRSKTERPNEEAFLSIFSLKTNIFVLMDKNWSLIGWSGQVQKWYLFCTASKEGQGGVCVWRRCRGFWETRIIWSPCYQWSRGYTFVYFLKLLNPASSINVLLRSIPIWKHARFPNPNQMLWNIANTISWLPTMLSWPADIMRTYNPPCLVRMDGVLEARVKGDQEAL